MRQICIIGPGRAGGALAIALSGAGAPVSEIAGRDASKAGEVAGSLSNPAKAIGMDDLRSISSEVIILAVSDGSISAVADKLAGLEELSSKTILHISGSRSSDVLNGLKSSGASTGSFHPLVSLSDPKSGSRKFSGAFFCVEGDPDAVRTATGLVELLKGIPFEIPSDKKPLYHASAVIACGHLVALIDLACEGLGECGLAREEAKKILLPLITSTVDNLRSEDLSTALTGPFARTDLTTIESHIEAMSNPRLDEYRKTYLLLGLRSLELAKLAGADRESTSKIGKKIRGLLKKEGL